MIQPRRSISVLWRLVVLQVLSFGTINKDAHAYIGIGTSVGESWNDLRVPFRLGVNWLIEPTIGIVTPWEKTYGDYTFGGGSVFSSSTIRAGLGLYYTSKFETAKADEGTNDFGYIGPVGFTHVFENTSYQTYGLVIGGEHFMMVNPRTNEYNRFSLAAESQFLMIGTSSGDAYMDVNAFVVARYYFGSIKMRMNFEVKTTDRLGDEGEEYDFEDYE